MEEQVKDDGLVRVVEFMVKVFTSHKKNNRSIVTSTLSYYVVFVLITIMFLIPVSCHSLCGSNFADQSMKMKFKSFTVDSMKHLLRSKWQWIHSSRLRYYTDNSVCSLKIKC